MHIIETKLLFEGWTKFLAVTLQGPEGRSLERAVLDHGTSVCVLPYGLASWFVRLVSHYSISAIASA
jgi:hypothetical protein